MFKAVRKYRFYHWTKYLLEENNHARVPVKDMTLPRGGGPDGTSPVAVLEGTQIRTLIQSFTRKLLTAAQVYGLLSLQHRTDLGVEDVEVWRPERWGMRSTN